MANLDEKSLDDEKLSDDALKQHRVEGEDSSPDFEGSGSIEEM